MSTRTVSTQLSGRPTTLGPLPRSPTMAALSLTAWPATSSTAFYYESECEIKRSVTCMRGARQTWLNHTAALLRWRRLNRKCRFAVVGVQPWPSIGVKGDGIKEHGTPVLPHAAVMPGVIQDGPGSCWGGGFVSCGRSARLTLTPILSTHKLTSCRPASAPPSSGPALESPVNHPRAGWAVQTERNVPEEKKGRGES